MKKRLLSLPFPIITLILELLPYGAVCNFANPDGEPIRKTFSYFSLTPFGYGNVAPLITAILTCVILLTGILYVISGKRAAAVMTQILLVAAAIVSLGSLVFGIGYYSIVGALITVSLIAGLTVTCLCRKNK